MRSSTARALLALVLLAVALEAIPTEQQATVLQPLTLTATFNIEPGDAVAPHIYDWYFDGVDDYISVADKPVLNPDDFTVEMYVAWISPPRRYSFWAMKGDWLVEGWQVFQDFSPPSRLYFETYDNVDRARKSMARIGAVPHSNRFYHIVFKYESYRGQHGYVDTSLVASITDVKLYRKNTKPLLIIPRNGNDVLVAFFRFYARALSDPEIQWNYANPANPIRDGLVLFLDATFFNGTHYIDLSGMGNHGVGYNGVSRVLSSRPHLYLVKGLHGDGLVHFRFFPVNTVVDVYNATTNSLVASFTVDGPANQAGLVEDYAVSLQAGTYRLAVYTTVYVQVARPALPASKLVVAHFKAEFGPGCRVYIDYTAWPKAEPRTECGLQTDATFLTGLPAGATVRVWNETVLYEVTASSTGVAVLGGLKRGAYEVKVYSDTLHIPYDHLLRLDPLTGLRRFFGFWDRLTFSLFTPVFVIGLVLAVYLRTWSAILTALVALAAHIVIAPDNIWIRGLLALALAVAVYIAMWRRTTLI
jgi:hypothetical protein